MPTTSADGKICYIEIPAADVEESAEFYKKVFGWNVRRRSDGAVAFDDTIGEVSGTWVLGREPTRKPGVIFHIMVDDINKTLDYVVKNGCEIIQPVGADAPEISARILDPGGNVVGLYQEPKRKS